MIVDLKDYPQHIKLIANWIFNYWGKYYPNCSKEDVLQELQRQTILPKTLIAIQGDLPIGTVSLYEEDGLNTSLTPWLGSLFVLPDYRHQGIGKHLIESAILEAKSMDYPNLYIITLEHSLTAWYAQMGWHFLKKDDLNGYPVDVMRLIL